MESFKTLFLAIEFYEKIADLELTGFTKNQLQQGAASIAMSLSEGASAESTEQQKNCFHAAQDSLIECQIILKMMVAKEIALLNAADHLEEKIVELLKATSPESLSTPKGARW